MRWEIFLTHPAVQAFGRALLNSLWQGSLLAFVLWTVKKAAPGSARVRYGAASLVMLMMPVALVVTVAQGLRHEPLAVGMAPVASSHLKAPAETSREVLLAALLTSAPRAGISGWAVCIWIAGVMVLSLRTAGGWRRAQRLKRCVLAAGGDLEDMMTRLTRGLGISAPVRLCTSVMVRVPTVIGWVRPYILLPVTSITGLSESQLEAIVAHELAHIRRHDYLINLFQTAIETVLFYHPAVWWVGKQMRVEREHCCDDIAVAVCGNALEYARALAELEQIRCRIPEPALAATGGDLLGRIRRLVGQQDYPSRSPGTIAAAVVLACAATAIAFTAGIARAQPVSPAFEVASIKPNKSGEQGGGSRFAGSSYIGTNVTLKRVIRLAYSPIQEFAGGAGWLDSEHFDITAKAEGNPSRERLQLMLRSLLADRFKLVVHKETRDVPAFALTLARSDGKLGPSLRRSNMECPEPNQGKGAGSCGFRIGDGALAGRGATMERLAAELILTGRPVVDRTGLTGIFDMDMQWAPDDLNAELFAALRDQLGLKLEAIRAPAEVIVIDSAERPSDN